MRNQRKFKSSENYDNANGVGFFFVSQSSLADFYYCYFLKAKSNPKP